ncbi:MAG TPA: protein-disulfide reductase DsbD domain-containing protein, partial [Thermoanaerobaculia bacterium]|nr:protein-disulfide reductase DsbD domain-containing protein [Thermoanaerobaculia bacterium]
MKTSLLILALLVPLQAWGAASEWAENAESRVRLVTPWQVAPQSGELRMGLHFKLAPGWHVYWKNSGDAGFPPVVVFQNLGETELLWPAPERFELPGDLVAFGYEDEVVYPVRAKLDAQGDRLRLAADVDYLVCQVDCIPYRYTLTLDQPLGTPVPDTATAPLIDRAWASVPSPAGEGVTTTAALDVSRPSAPVLEVRVEGARPGPDSQIFLESHEGFDTGKPVSQ